MNRSKTTFEKRQFVLLYFALGAAFSVVYLLWDIYQGRAITSVVLLATAGAAFMAVFGSVTSRFSKQAKSFMPGRATVIAFAWIAFTVWLNSHLSDQSQDALFAFFTGCILTLVGVLAYDRHVGGTFLGE